MNGQMINGQRVADLRPHLGLLKGMIKVGLDRDAQPIIRPMFWMPSGQLTDAAPGPHDLDMASFGVKRIDARRSLDDLVEHIRIKHDIEFDDIDDYGELPF